MSLTPPPPVTRRDWTLPIIAGVVAIVVVLAVCLVGSAATFVSLRRQVGTDPAPSGLPVPPVMPTQPNVKTGVDCLIGDWIQTNTTSRAEIFGAAVQLSGKGTVARYAANGTYVALMDNVVLSGTAAGDVYEVIFTGSLGLNYTADATTIRYSNPISQSTTTWKVNGRVRATQPTTATLEPDTYQCQGNELRLLWSDGAAEYRRILPPGVPA